LGLLECSSYHLNIKEDLQKFNIELENIIEVEESKTEYSILRSNLILNLLKILSENTDSSYPQRIFEMGRVLKKTNKGKPKPV
jgi:phenylalanyl-tRNA synthetase beta subunit